MGARPVRRVGQLPEDGLTLIRRPGVALVTPLPAARRGVHHPGRALPADHRFTAPGHCSSRAAGHTRGGERDAPGRCAALNTDEEIEKLAREKLGYVRPGETAYVVLDPPGAANPPSWRRKD